MIELNENIAVLVEVKIGYPLVGMRRAVCVTGEGPDVTG